MRKKRQSVIKTTKREISIQAIQCTLIESEKFTNQMESNNLPLYQSDDERIVNTVYLFERTKSVSGFGLVGGNTSTSNCKEGRQEEWNGKNTASAIISQIHSSNRTWRRNSIPPSPPPQTIHTPHPPSRQKQSLVRHPQNTVKQKYSP
jgi:hypothetical protein